MVLPAFNTGQMDAGSVCEWFCKRLMPDRRAQEVSVNGSASARYLAMVSPAAAAKLRDGNVRVYLAMAEILLFVKANQRRCVLISFVSSNVRHGAAQLRHSAIRLHHRVEELHVRH